MEDKKPVNLDDETIRQLGLQPCYEPINAPLAPYARVFIYPSIEGVYVMESDLYGNSMPEGSIFLAFRGRSGLIGKHLHIHTLKSSSVEDIRKMVEDNNAG